MEHAIHIIQTDDRNYVRTGPIDRLYWGTEFCRDLIPPIEDTISMMVFASNRRLGFTFVTPYVDEEGLQRLEETFDWCLRKSVTCEVVVNDWRVLDLLKGKEEQFTPILGRLLVRQQPDPSVLASLEGLEGESFLGEDGVPVLPDQEVPQALGTTETGKAFIEWPGEGNLLEGLGVGRVELSHVARGVGLPEGFPLRTSIYTPYVHLSTIRTCSMEATDGNCRKECLASVEALVAPSLAGPILKRGNSLFYENPIGVRGAAEAGYDRIVFQPKLPL